ncbi:CDP-diacylglycerol--glycerol-3-phosphate 3-phosphatidyltransferase [Cryobacterium mesophilum]|nr:CDP-diacylglycerol--glycerol-3-phosphate 3-phosphatidyltransferase [Terrimesophilobacter mesophilus]
MALPATPPTPKGSGRSNPMRGRVARSGDTPASTGNVANIITVVRIFLAPVFIWLLFADNHEFGALRYVAAALFILAIVTDSVDGLLARRQNLVTDFGKILDPIADKVLIGGALVTLSILGELWWWVTILILVREFGITVFRLAVVRDRVIPASRGGKLKTIVQAIAISFYLVPVWLLLGDWMHWFNAVLMAIALAFTLVTGADYLVKAIRHGRGHIEAR